MKLAVIGYGTIVKLALETMSRELPRPLNSLAILARPGGEGRAEAMLQSLGPKLAHKYLVTPDMGELLSLRPDCVAEAAGHEALRSAGAACLRAGADLVVTSVGALADDALRQALDAAAAMGGAAYSPIAGAIGGMDILAAARLAGIESVTYTGRKPPKAWKGTRAESLVDLDRVTQETVFFDGVAGVAARDFPQNANVAATLALGGAGFENTRVRLIADPAIIRNVHEISVRAACADFDFRVEGYPSPDNPKTSMTVAYSLAAELLRRAREA